MFYAMHMCHMWVSRLGAINNKNKTQCKLAKSYTCATIKGGATAISMDFDCEVGSQKGYKTFVVSRLRPLEEGGIKKDSQSLQSQGP